MFCCIGVYYTHYNIKLDYYMHDYTTVYNLRITIVNTRGLHAPEFDALWQYKN